MNKTRPLFLLALCLLLAGGLTAEATAAAPRPAPGRVVVSFEPGMAPTVAKAAGGLKTGMSELDAVLARHGVVEMEPLFGNMLYAFPDPATQRDLARHYILRHVSKAGNDALSADLKALRIVDTAESDLVFEAHGSAYLPNDLAAPQWHLRNTSIGGGDTRAVGGWSESLGDSNVVVAVLDTGIDWHHPDLGGPHPDKVNGALWTNWDEYNGLAGVDDDHNGFTDDIRGWDFVNISSTLVWPGEDAGPADNNPMDFNGHGTLVAGCVAPITDNGTGIAAIAPGCKIMAIRIGFTNTDGGGNSYASLMASGFLYAAANGADIINLSYSTGYTSAFASAINAALNAGLVICVSAGNENTDVAGYLQGLADDRILAVAATGTGDNKAGFSNYGTWVDVSAPGESIYTTAYDFTSGTSTYESTQGTSFSSPIVAGACALIWSAHPEYSAAQVAALIQSSSDDLDAGNPLYAGQLGAGRVNLQRALGDRVHQYPQEFPTLFDAMNCAASGDTVKVLGSATVAGPVTVFGDGLKLFGGYDATYTTRDLATGRTQISGGAGGLQLTFAGAMSPATEVDGFDISGGTGQSMNVVAPSTRCAGGVLVNLVSPTLRNLKVHGNTVGSAGQLGCGGGVLLFGSSAVLENCEITGNTGIYGAGVFVSGGAPSLINCTITNNTLLTNNLTYTPRGGGLYGQDTNLRLENCTISGHLNADLGGGAYFGGASTMSNVVIEGGTIAGNTAKSAGGGLYHTGGTLHLTDTIVENNSKTLTATFMYGGGAQIAGGAAATIDGLIFRGNQAQNGGGLALAECASATVSGSVFSGNYAKYSGGALLMETCSSGTISGNTAYGNSGSSSGGSGFYISDCSPAITRNISAFNLGGAGSANGIAVESGTPTLSCNDVYGNQNAAWSGITDPTGTDGNIAVDPLFCDAAGGNFGLQAASVCRPENSGACGLIGAVLGACYVSEVPGGDGLAPTAFRVEQCFPNPFNPQTTIRFALPAAAHTTVKIFDVAGRHVKTLVDADLEARAHDVVWVGDDARGQSVAAGVYFYEVSGGGHRAVGRMALVK
jgi:predicted outer membrane repeat protein